MYNYYYYNIHISNKENGSSASDSHFALNGQLELLQMCAPEWVFQKWMLFNFDAIYDLTATASNHWRVWYKWQQLQWLYSCTIVTTPFYVLRSLVLTLITPTTSNTEAAMQQIIIAYMKNLSSADKHTNHSSAVTQSQKRCSWRQVHFTNELKWKNIPH